MSRPQPPRPDERPAAAPPGRAARSRPTRTRPDEPPAAAPEGPAQVSGPSSSGPPAGGLSPEQAAEARAALAAERDGTLARITALRREFQGIVDAAADANADDEHDPEGATIAFERAQVAALLAAAEDHLADLDAALARLAEGGYGNCQRCGQPIAPARLAARPAARTCISCATRRH
jgi:DnaK suppressor protein